MIPPGTRLGNYEVIAPLGSGGMGEVYRARDARLGRIVALKVLPPELAEHADRVRRFEGEARAASALNHPHIISIFETGQSDSISFIVMELVEGVQFDQWVERQRPGLRRVLQVITQIADALSAAHQAGIIHRDLKPANVIVTPQGYAKVLDFGLAKMVDAPGVSNETRSVLNGMTGQGAVIGTAAYMSPEQALGRAVDARTDVFSLGAIIYEATTGRRPFSANSTLDLLHAVVHDEPPHIREISPDSPQELGWIVGKALAKDPEERYQTMRELAVDLRRLARALEGRGSPPQIERRTSDRVARALVVALLVTMTGAGWVLGRFGDRSVKTATTRPPVVTLTQLTSDPGYEGEATFSPDGRTIAFVSDRTGDYEIFLRQVSGGPAINLTNNPADDVQPSFSPDGRQIAFVSSRAGTSQVLFGQPRVPLLGGDIWVMPALGGSARRVAEQGNFPSWSPNGAEILYTGGGWFGQKLYRVGASGGTPAEIPIRFPTTRLTSAQLTYPHYSPDGRWVLVVGTPGDIYVIKAEGGEPVPIARGSMAVWTPDSQSIIYSNAERGRNDSLWRLEFDVDSGRVRTPPEALTVDRGSDLQPAMSPDGKLVAFTAVEVSSNIERLPFDPETSRPGGVAQQVTSGKDAIYFFTAAPDGRAVSFGLTRGSGSCIWRADADGKTTQLTSEAQFEDGAPRWSPDGRTIAFSRRSMEVGARGAVWVMEADGGNPRPAIDNVGLTGLFAWTFDARRIVYVSTADRQLYVADLAAKSTRRLTNEPGVMPIIATSRDGRWAVYQSVQMGDVDLYAVPLQGGPSRQVVATAHKDYHPSLSPTGRWLYYLRDHNALYRVPGPAQDWRSSPPERVIDFRLPAGMFVEDPQISHDGRYLLYSRGRIAGDIWVASIERPALSEQEPRP